MLPNFVIIGAQKSASTFIQHCLAEHPEVYMPSGETPFFESPDYEQLTISSLKTIFNGRTEKRVGIKRPSYIGKPEVPCRIQTHLPHAKLVAVLRNPIERAISAYHHYINGSFIPARNVEKGMRQLLDGAYQDKYMRSREIIEFGFYYKYLIQYQYFFERKQLLILLHENILADRLSSVQTIYSFLDVDPHYVPKAINATPQAVLYNIPRLRFLSLRNQFIYYYNPDRTRLFMREDNPIGKAVANIIAAIDDRLLSIVFKNKKPAVSAELKDRLFEIYRGDIERLQSYTGIDLSHWEPS